MQLPRIYNLFLCIVSFYLSFIAATDIANAIVNAFRKGLDIVVMNMKETINVVQNHNTNSFKMFRFILLAPKAMVCKQTKKKTNKHPE